MKRNYSFFLLFGIGLIFFIYWPVINGYFLGEDYAWWGYVRGKSLFEVLPYFVLPPNQAMAGFYHPLVAVFYWLNVNFSWMNPVGFHLTNLGIHLGNYLLVIGLAHFFFKQFWPSLLAGFFFLLFPFQSEAVAWIDGRHDLLMTLFYLSSFLFFLRWQQKGRTVNLLISLFSFFLALAAKETAVTLPVALMVYRWREPKTGIAWFWLVLVFYFFLHALYVGGWNPFGAASHLGIIVARIFVFYLIFLAFSLVFCFSVRRFKFWNKKSLELVPLLAILIGVFYFPAAFTFTEERYLYLPSTMASIFMANFFSLFWISKLLEERKLARLFLVLVLLAGSLASLNYLTKRVADWQKAAAIARGVVDDFRVEAREVPKEATIYFFNLPDNYHGSYIFRTHVKEALAYGTNRENDELVVFPPTLGIKGVGVEIADKQKLVLKSPDGFLIFAPTITAILPSGEKVMENETYRLVVKNRQTLEVSLKKDYLGKPGAYFLEYRDGRLSPL